MYAAGAGVKKDFAEAAKWFRKAAAQGNAIAMNNLGYMYEQGNGVKKDYAEALKWYQKAAELDDEAAKKALERLRPLLSQ
jgi:TPR repeat protein